MVTSHGLPDLPHHYGYHFSTPNRPVYHPMYQYYMPHQAMPLRYQQEYSQQGQTYLPPYHADKKNNDNKQEYAHADIHREDIHNADTRHADLHHAVTLHAHPHHADTLHGNLHHADIHHADMHHTDVHHKDLHQAKAQIEKYCQNQLRIFVSAVQFWLLCC